MSEQRVSEQHVSDQDLRDQDAPAQPAPSTDGRVADLETQVNELQDSLRRALADLDNLRKRFARDVDRERADERARVAAEWLPVLDTLEMALEHAQAQPSAIVEGVRGVRDQALTVLSRLGYPRRNDIGELFDPARHQAVSTVADSDEAPGTVVHVVRPRYGQGEQQLRPASVVVSTGAG